MVRLLCNALVIFALVFCILLTVAGLSVILEGSSKNLPATATFTLLFGLGIIGNLSALFGINSK